MLYESEIIFSLANSDNYIYKIIIIASVFSNLCCLLWETVGPLGILGWEQIQQLANALFDLRDCTALTEAQVIHLIRVWSLLPTALKEAKVMYPPRYRSDNKHWGRFMQKKTSATHMQTVMPGTVSLKKVNMVDSFQLLTNDLKGKILTLKINNSDFSKSFFFSYL